MENNIMYNDPDYIGPDYIEYADQVNFTYDPPCGNGIDEELFNKAVEALEYQDCDERGPDYGLLTPSDVGMLESNPTDIIRYDLEGFGRKDCSLLFWLFIIVLIILVFAMCNQSNNKLF